MLFNEGVSASDTLYLALEVVGFPIGQATSPGELSFVMCIFLAV